MASQPIKLYYNDGHTEDYTPTALLWQPQGDGVVLVTWNTPDSLNAIAPNIVNESLAVLEHAKRDDSVKVLVWTGAGRAFSSGAQLKPRFKGDGKVQFPKEAIKDIKARGQYWEPIKDIAMKLPTLAFWDFPKPSIVAVNGLAVGGAVNIAFCNYHDYVVCSSEAKFKYPFVKLGITPELGSSYILPKLIGIAKAKELFLGGEWFTAQDALRFGLANEVVPPEKVVETALAVAKKWAASNQSAMKAGKDLINSHFRKEMDAVLDTENAYIRKQVLGGGKFREVMSKL